MGYGVWGLNKTADMLDGGEIMGITKFTSREFDRHIGRVKKAAVNGPVFITKRGRNSYVLMTFEEYIRIGGRVEVESLRLEGDSIGETD